MEHGACLFFRSDILLSRLVLPVHPILSLPKFDAESPKFWSWIFRSLILNLPKFDPKSYWVWSWISQSLILNLPKFDPEYPKVWSWTSQSLILNLTKFDPEYPKVWYWISLRLILNLPKFDLESPKVRSDTPQSVILRNSLKVRSRISYCSIPHPKSVIPHLLKFDPVSPEGKYLRNVSPAPHEETLSLILSFREVRSLPILNSILSLIKFGSSVSEHVPATFEEGWKLELLILVCSKDSRANTTR